LSVQPAYTIAFGTSFVRLSVQTHTSIHNRLFIQVPVVFAEEKARMSLLPLEEHQEDDPSAYKPVHNLRLRVIPVLGVLSRSLVAQPP
jgi:hypothetical protein